MPSLESVASSRWTDPSSFSVDGPFLLRGRVRSYRVGCKTVRSAATQSFIPNPGKGSVEGMAASSRPGRGPATAGKRRVPLSRERIVTAALAVIERAPETKLTLAAVASELGVATMSLYTHVRNREELLEAVRAAALAKFEFVPKVDDDWERQLSQLLHALRQHAARYPFLAFEPAEFPVVWPALLEPLVAILRRAGLRGVDLAESTRWIGRKIGILALLDQSWPLGRAAKPASYPDFPAEAASELRDVLPYLAKGDPDHAFEFAVERAIAAIRDLVRKSGAS
ncbi:MAG: TetR/AcrR family transcriptional regulator [Deltaproteobacteria bacterium]|nr:TetR/AcrR family transcriptional regulator [Deltaproteobacteria bacterium]